MSFHAVQNHETKAYNFSNEEIFLFQTGELILEQKKPLTGKKF